MAFRGLFGSYKRSIAVLIVLGLLGGLLESAGVSILVPLFAHILQQPIAGTGFITDAFDWFFNFTGLELRLRVLLPLIFIAFGLRAVVQWAFEYVRTSITLDYERNMRRDLFRKFLLADWSFLMKQKIGHVENEVVLSVTVTTKLLSNLANSILQLTTLAAYVVVAFTISVEMTLATLIVGGIVLFAFKPLLTRTRGYGTILADLGKKLAHDVNESVLGLKSIKASGRERSVMDAAQNTFDEYRAARLKQSMVATLNTAAVQPITVLFIAGVFMYAFNRPGFDLASFVVIIFLIQRIFLYVDRAQATLHDINKQIPHASSIIRFLAVFDEHRERTGGTKPFVFKNSITFKDVSFGYREQHPVLAHATLEVAKGETVGIIGPSGAGKTTLADLLLRLLTPMSGSISLDSTPVEEIALTDWRAHVAYVSQEFFLLNDSVLANVQFYDPDVTEEDAARAIHTVGLSQVVEKLPQGIHTLVGERGMELSVGQRQRIALARALVRKPSILVLDEATSALDGESEQAIHEALQKLHGTMTMIIIAHRLTTVMETDKIIVVDKGNIAEEGAPQELLKDENSYFYRLTHLQE
ncbi:MAG: ABC transporter ATP-binding protein [Candidatus Pacebacteria bacterium]|nr:ABC transporter ATP-binding protein [Candidatus Paceibacterota bacterium]